ncbi:MAG: ABC transporter ATP-binding protein [Thermoplasmata archaeon]
MTDDAFPMIIIRGLSKSYNAGRRPIIDNLDLDIDKGEIVILMGRSGCGKTTLLNLIAGLDRPDKGSITVDGTRMDTMSEDQLARFRLGHIGFVFQDYNLISQLTIRQNVELPLRLAGIKDDKAARNLLKIFDIEDIADQEANTVSGGEAQRAAIARAMANNPKVLLADEPTGNLDAENEKVVMRYFKKIREEFDTTIVVATHNKDLVGYGNRTINFAEIQK